MSHTGKICLAVGVVAVILLCITAAVYLLNRNKDENFGAHNRDGGNNSLPGYKDYVVKVTETTEEDAINYTELSKSMALESGVAESHRAFVKEIAGRTRTASHQITSDHENLLNSRQGFRSLNTSVKHIPGARQLPTDYFDEFPEYKRVCF